MVSRITDFKKKDIGTGTFFAKEERVERENRRARVRLRSPGHWQPEI